ncbi:hypothetical protein BU24DRAFT_496612 [Aaosphaeria arxii CBS 175.79]|uniref:Zn(2)-C6 fungal-type domain-containing protein n=1 Tax=Aaosphaeria arxii CBS 175.79 TaxID=1450172 RepID=A0A6A5XCS8_9PLEO|nr:uncharacterized protein BU24DRAFT_496612 [Aaosphaeria arxii CBS 175.79]KAF2010673.1 hypothetical protein BU24DRAFT_496612 [Aaosphaeria arxii CBS 175.79]
MTESNFTSNHPQTPTSSHEQLRGIDEDPSVIIPGSKKKQPSSQSRQLLSCTKCRERKVKCDRTKPCSACCARGQPKECFFVAEGGDYAPIQQSYELRKLRIENQRLKERLKASKSMRKGDDSDDASTPHSPHACPANKAHKRRLARQRRFQNTEPADSLYFGSPGLASAISEFANSNTSLPGHSLAHAMPRGADMYAPRDLPLYPFATLFSWSLEECIPELLRCLPPKDELFGYLDSFQRRAQVCCFPHTPEETAKTEVERFLSESRKNADGCPEMLALLFAVLALGSQHGVWDNNGGKWVVGAVEKESQRGNLYIAAAMQALRMASYMNRPNLLSIQTFIMVGSYLTDSGRFLDAWTLFGTTVRLAQSIGLHRHPKHLDAPPSTQKECALRQTIWWWMLHLDQHYSMTLGRPLGISAIGDCPPPHELTTDTTFLRFAEFVYQFTLLARQVLSSDRLNNHKIDEFTDLFRSLLETMPEQLHFNESWLDEGTEIPEWPLGPMAAAFYCKTLNYLILLNRQRLEKPLRFQSTMSATAKPSLPPFNPVKVASAQPPRTALSDPALRGRALVLSCCEDLLTTFLFYYSRVPVALISWTIGQQAFNASMILILDALENRDLRRIWKVEKAYVVFTQLDENRVHRLAKLAVERISWGLGELKRMQDDAAAAMARPVGHTQGADESEAIPCTTTTFDTVMGNTGMFLLEDPGLQVVAPEDFSPLGWTMAGENLEDYSQFRIKQEEAQKLEEPGRCKVERSPHVSGDEIYPALLTRSSDPLQGTQGTPGSGHTPSRYATFSTQPSHGSPEQGQPQGLQASTPPATVSVPNMRHDVGGPQSFVQLSPYHARHSSYPSLQYQQPTHRGPPLGTVPGSVTGNYVPHLSARYLTGMRPSLSQAPPQRVIEHPDDKLTWTTRPPSLPSTSISDPALTFTSAPRQDHAFQVEDAQASENRTHYVLSTAAHECQSRGMTVGVDYKWPNINPEP